MKNKKIQSKLSTTKCELHQCKDCGQMIKDIKKIAKDVNRMRRIMVNPVPDSDEVSGYNTALNDVLKYLNE